MAANTNRWMGAGLWVLAVVLMLSTAVYQRMTGPTHPARGSVAVEGATVDYKLIRSENTGTDAVVAIPDPGAPATLKWRRYRTGDDWTAVAMQPGEDGVQAALPTQPPAGKLEYFVEVAAPSGALSIPPDESVVIRYKGAVPAAVLVPHVFCMFFGILWGLRTLLEVLTGRPGVRWMAWTTLGLIGLGGMTLGPIVQLYAFGEAWTGVPFGWDLTDNKTLVMFLSWIGAVSFVRTRGEITTWARRVTVGASLVMIAVYLVPHSMFGSELDYEAVDQGLSPEEAIKTGRQPTQP